MLLSVIYNVYYTIPLQAESHKAYLPRDRKHFYPYLALIVLAI